MYAEMQQALIFKESVNVLTTLLADADDSDNQALRIKLTKARFRLLEALEEQQEQLAASRGDKVVYNV